jgi:hypothetical protein
MSGIVLSNDSNPLFYKQWALKNIAQPIYLRTGQYELPLQEGIAGVDINHISGADLPSKSIKDVIVAVIDTGVDIHHPELEGRLWINPKCTKKNADLCIGKNILNPNKAAYDDKGHGTHVAGIIAANDNNIGVQGVTSSNIKIMPIKVLSNKIKSFGYKGRNIADYFAKGIEFAIDNNADVINMSVGFPQLVLTSKFRAAVKKAEKHNIPLIVAAGNNRKDIPVFPCSLESVICVGSVDNLGEMSVFSNYGHMVDILAPGQSIVSTYPISKKNGEKPSRKLRIPGFENMQGTSQAAPFVAAIAAMIKDQYPSITLNELKGRLFSSAREKLHNIEKFSLNGLVDMKRAIVTTAPSPYVYPIFKENSQIVINKSDLKFEYKLKLNKLIGSEDNVVVDIISSGKIVFQNVRHVLSKIKADQVVILNLKGQFSSLLDNSLVPLEFKVTSNGKSRVFKANLSFSMSIDALNHDTYEFNNIDSKLLFSKRGKRTFSLLRYVTSALNNVMPPEYFVLQKRKNKKSELSVLSLEDKKVSIKKLHIDSKEEVVNIIKGDMNFDGTSDYLVLTYAGSKVESENAFYLYYTDNDLAPLFGEGNSRIRFKDDSTTILIKNGGNLFNFDKRLINFSWMKESLEGIGNLMVPVISQKGLIPFSDNSSDILDFKMPNLTNKTYVLIPEKNKNGIDFKARLLVSQVMKERIMEAIEDLGESVQPWETIKVESPLYQPQVNNGVLSYVLSVGEMFNRKFYKLNFNSYRAITVELLNPLNENNLVLSSNSTFEYLKSPFQGSLNSKVFFKLDSRSTGRAAFFNVGKSVYSQEVMTESYSDPLFGFISTFNVDGRQKSFFESRYWVQFFDQAKVPLRFPVNRESSFPGVEFSETMEGVFGSIGGSKELGVFVNSTLLYGNQIHAIFPVDNKLQRPLGLTIEIPSNCSYMLPTHFLSDTFSSFALNCVENKKSVLKYLPVNI